MAKAKPFDQGAHGRPFDAAQGKPIVGVVMGSDSDWPVMKETVALLRRLKVPSEARVLSAHRSPEEAGAFARDAEKSGVRVIIAAAGARGHRNRKSIVLTSRPILR